MIIGETVHVEVDWHVPGFGADLRDEPSSSCGCTEVDGWTLARDGGTASIVVAPGPFDRQIDSDVVFHGVGGATVVISVRGQVQPPFEGWPQRAQAERLSDGSVLLRVSPAYETHEILVKCFVDADDPTGVIATRDPSGFAIPDATSEIVVAFRGSRESQSVTEEKRWAGPLSLAQDAGN